MRLLPTTRTRHVTLAVLIAVTVIRAQSTMAQQPVSGAGSQSAQPGPRTGDDPNLPSPAPQDFSRGLVWDWAGASRQVMVTLPPPFDPSGRQSTYLGYTEEGSYIKNQNDGKVVVWNLPPGAQKGTLTVRYNSVLDIPLDVLRELDRSTGVNSQVKGLIARKSLKHDEQPAPVAQQPQPNTGGGAMGELVRNSVTANGGLGLQGNNAMSSRAPQGIMTGTSAAVKDGVLTFSDRGGKRVSMKVQPGNGTGVWLALSVDGKDGNDKMVNVQPNGNVVALPLDPALKAQMMQAHQQ